MAWKAFATPGEASGDEFFRIAFQRRCFASVILIARDSLELTRPHFTHTHTLFLPSALSFTAAPFSGSPELEVAINEHLNTISKCAFDGSCPAPDVLTKELKTAREQDWKTVLNFLEEQAFDAGEGGEGKEKEGEGGAGLGVEEGDNNIRSEIRRIFQRLLMKSREEEGRRVR